MGDIISVEEKTGVISRFEDGQFRPVSFLWRGRARKVKKVTGRWGSHDGQYRIYHFSIVSETDDFFEMSFHTRDMSWYIDRFMTE